MNFLIQELRGKASSLGSGAEAIVLPIIYNIRKVKITESYHKFLGLTRIGAGCEGRRNHFVVMILSILQNIWVGVRRVGV
jgi:hypothetical protein